MRIAARAWLVVAAVTACGKGGDAPTAGSATAPAPVVAPAPTAPAPAPALDAALPVNVTPPPKPPQPPDTRAAALEDDAARFAQILAGEGSGSVPGSFDRRIPGGDLPAQLAEVHEGGANVAGGDAPGRGPRGDASPLVGTGRGPVAGDVSTPSGPAGRIQIASKKSLDDTTLSIDVVLAKVQSAYMAGVRRCYKQALKTDPSLTGTLTLRFTVNATGRATAPTATGPRDDVAACVTTGVANWRFPTPLDADDAATAARFELRLRLVPE